MVNYRNGKIFKLVSAQTNQYYLGVTCSELWAYLYTLRKNYQNNYINKKHEEKHQAANQLMKYDDVKIQLYELYPCNSKEELNQRLEALIGNSDDNLVVNIIKQQKTRHDYYIQNRERNLLMAKEYYVNHCEELRPWFNQANICQCGGSYTNVNQSHHNCSQKHQSFIAAC